MNLIIRDDVPPLNDNETEKTRSIDDLMKERRLCPCGRMFTPYRPYQHYCCDAHRVKYTKGRPKKSYYTKKPIETRYCKECKKPFETNDSKRQYCSKECYELHEEKRLKHAEERVCFVCGKSFTTTHWLKRYCSEECRLKARLT
jgi:hypothetical protein